MKKITLLYFLLQISFCFAQNAPIDFEPEGFGANWTWATFEAPAGEENPTFSVVANPSIDATNASATVAKMDISYGTGANWGSAGCESMHNADLGAFTVTSSNSLVKMMVYQEGFAAPVALKFATNSGYALGEVVTANTVADAWVEVEFNMSEWIGNPNGAPDQIIFFPSYAARATGHIVYFDNVTFNASGGTGGGDAPTAGAPEPTRDAADVLSIFSDRYTNVPVEDLNPNWNQATVVTEELIGGNNTLVYKGLDYQGLQLAGSLDVSGMSHLHIDYWTANSTTLNAFLISNGPVETPSSLSVPTAGWASVDIALTDFTPVDLADLIQFKFDGNGDIYLDNIYFYKDGETSGGGDMPNAPIDFEPEGFGADWTWTTFEAPEGEDNPTFSVVTNPSIDATNGSATVAKMDISYGTGANWGSAGCESMHDADLGAFTVRPSNSRVKMMIYQEGFAAPVALKFATNTGYALGEVVIGNSVVDAWVEVEFNMSAWIGNPNGNPDQIIFFPSYAARTTGHTVYFDNVTFNGAPPEEADPMISAPNPTIDEGKVLSVFSDYYANNNTVSNFNFNAFQGAGMISEIDIENDGNITGKIEDLTYYGAQWDAVDLTSYEYLHINYWATTSTAFNVYLIDQTAGIPGGSIEEARYSIAASGGDETLVKGEWKSVFIPLQHFVDYPSGNFTYDLNDIFQWKFDGNGTVFFDNIYFTSATDVSTNDIQLGSIGAYPNPTNNSWMVKTPNVDISLIEVFDRAGRNVLSIYPNNTSEAEIDGGSLNTGLYFAKITTRNGVFSAKLVKE